MGATPLTSGADLSSAVGRTASNRASWLRSSAGRRTVGSEHVFAVGVEPFGEHAEPAGGAASTTRLGSCVMAGPGGRRGRRDWLQACLGDAVLGLVAGVALELQLLDQPRAGERGEAQVVLRGAQRVGLPGGQLGGCSSILIGLRLWFGRQVGLGLRFGLRFGLRVGLWSWFRIGLRLQVLDATFFEDARVTFREDEMVSERSPSEVGRGPWFALSAVVSRILIAVPTDGSTSAVSGTVRVQPAVCSERGCGRGQCGPSPRGPPPDRGTTAVAPHDHARRHRAHTALIPRLPTPRRRGVARVAYVRFGGGGRAHASVGDGGRAWPVVLLPRRAPATARRRSWRASRDGAS